MSFFRLKNQLLFIFISILLSVQQLHAGRVEEMVAAAISIFYTTNDSARYHEKPKREARMKRLEASPEELLTKENTKELREIMKEERKKGKELEMMLQILDLVDAA